MEHRATVEISSDDLERINRYLTEKPTSADECLDEDETIIYTAVFENGYEMDIKCCGVQYHEDEDCNTAWSEAVLFKNGSEVSCEYGEDDFEGEWVLEDDGDIYIAEVVAV